MHRALLIVLAAATLAAGCPTTGDDDDNTPDLSGLAAVRADRLTQWLAGEFNSVAQANQDPSFLEIQVVACSVDAPELGERVLYLEQAFTDELEAPHRQRLYVMTASSDDRVSASTRLFELDDPDAAIGLCDLGTTGTFAEAEVSEREDCGWNVAWDDTTQSFVGGTSVGDCLNSSNGATYATSEVTVRANGFDTWDRGYDADGDQVWTAGDGPYEFIRQ